MNTINTWYSRLVRNLERRTYDPLFHAALGLMSEAGELAALLKTEMITAEPVYEGKILDECADALHYIQMALNNQNFTLADAMYWNALKLYSRRTRGKDKAFEHELLVRFVTRRKAVREVAR